MVEAAKTSVHVITVSYRSAALVKQSLAALEAERQLEAARGIDVTCTVVDNASGDTPMLESFVDERGLRSWVRVLEAKRNGGFAFGNNRGFEDAFNRELDPDYFFLLNPDAIVRERAIGALVDFLEAHPKAGSAGSRLYNGDGSIWPIAFRFPNMVDQAVRPMGLGVLERLFERYMVSVRMGDEPQEVDWFPGAAMMVRASIIKDLGGMDESYFLYFEETDFCLKMKRAGWTNWYVPSSEVTHIAGQSTGVTGAQNEGKALPAYWYESRRRYFQKNFGLRYALATDAASLFGRAFGHVQQKVRGRLDPNNFQTIVDFYRGSSWPKANRGVRPSVEVPKPKG